MNYLALDLGTKTGYAASIGGKFCAGTWTLVSAIEIREQGKLRYDRRRDMRIPALYLELETWSERVKFDWVFFEDVQFSSTTLQTQMWASLRAAVWLWSYDYDVQIDCCPVATLKKFGTGYGGADKKAMERGARQRYQNWVPADHKFDDNALDSIHLLSWGMQTTARLKV